MAQIPSKRKSQFDEAPGRKAPKTAATGGGGGKKLSFAERMMAKMGHEAGKGLGRDGTGMLEPIEVKLRPQGVGVGTIKEKTEQAKKEAKRKAEIAGEEYEDSSEEDRKARRRRKQQPVAENSAGSGVSTPRGFERPKVRYQTATDIEKSAEGLEVPNVLKSIIDATGQETKLLTSAVGLMSGAGAGSAEDIEAEKLAKRARRELEGFADAWNDLTERKRFIELELDQLHREAKEQQKEIEEAEALVSAVEALKVLDLSSDGYDEDSHWTTLTLALEDLHSTYVGKVQASTLSDIAVAAIHPLFSRGISTWSPLDEPTRFVAYLERLKPVLVINLPPDALDEDRLRRRRATTPYDSLIYSMWLPKVRSAIINHWDAHEPQSVISLTEAWKPLLPDFVAYNLINVVVLQKLSSSLNAWNPRAALKPRKSSAITLHSWLFPWLPYLAPSHTDIHQSHSLLADVNRKLRVALDVWDLTKGILPGLAPWIPLLGSVLQHTLVRHMLPRLATHMMSHFEVNPVNQNLSSLEHVLVWCDIFPSKVMAQLLVSEFFPKWLNTLHVWLTMDNQNYEEIAAWYTWWKSIIPSDVNSVGTVMKKWGEGLHMMDMALDLGQEQKKTLSCPEAGPNRPLKTDAVENINTARSRPATNLPNIDENFINVVESWCETEALLFIPLREAHPSTGLPMFRITASATGKGGIKVYIQGDMLWALKKGERDVWEPYGLEEKLIQRAEGR